MVKIPPENTCAWCGDFVDEDVEIYAIGATFPSGVEMKNLEGTVIHIGLKDLEKKIPAIVTKNNSVAKEHGSDLMFMTCSKTCFKNLQSSLNKEGDLLDIKRL